MKKKILNKKLELKKVTVSNLTDLEMLRTKVGVSLLVVCSESCSILVICCESTTKPIPEVLNHEGID